MTQTTGFLATECALCNGTGTVEIGVGLQRRWFNCEDCDATGWTVHGNIPAVSIDHINSIASELHLQLTPYEALTGDASETNGWNEALLTLGKRVQEEFGEAR